MNDTIDVNISQRESSDVQHLFLKILGTEGAMFQLLPDVRAQLDDFESRPSIETLIEVTRVVGRYGKHFASFGLAMMAQAGGPEVWPEGEESTQLCLDREYVTDVAHVLRSLATLHSDSVKDCEPENCFAIGVVSFCNKLELALGTDLAGLAVADNTDASIPAREKLED